MFTFFPDRRSRLRIFSLICLAVIAAFAVAPEGQAAEGGVSREAIDLLSRTNRAMAEVVAAVRPSVVNIASTKTIRTRAPNSPFFDDPFFKRFFGDEFGSFGRPREYKQSGLGSGVIVDADGYILTNNHVIQGADEILVKLSDKREFKAKVIGADTKTDIAVLKIDSSNLPVVRMGDSDSLRVGETVIAVGNPFGLNLTVTSGIVSATGRANVGIADYEDFIQTDAPINPGNSGGALVNIRGELIGVNTAIFSTSGGYQGIGFAIPSNMAKTVMESLVKRGKVIRGWFGTTVQPVTAAIARQFGLKDEKGALVADVMEGSPAEKAGIERGDVIVEFNGREIDDPTALRNMAANTPPGKEVSVAFLREGKKITAKTVMTELPGEMQKKFGSIENVLKGLYVQDLTTEIKRSLEMPERLTGVIITDIEDGSAAEGILAQNDVILEINRRKVASLREYEDIAAKLRPDQGALLLVYRDKATIYFSLTGR